MFLNGSRKSPGFWGAEFSLGFFWAKPLPRSPEIVVEYGNPSQTPEFRFRNYRTICSDSYGTSRWVSLGNVALMRPWVVYHRAMMRVNMVPSGGVGGDSDADLGGILFLKDGVKLDKKVGLGDLYIYICI